MKQWNTFCLLINSLVKAANDAEAENGRFIRFLDQQVIKVLKNSTAKIILRDCGLLRSFKAEVEVFKRDLVDKHY